MNSTSKPMRREGFGQIEPPKMILKRITHPSQPVWLGVNFDRIGLQLRGRYAAPGADATTASLGSPGGERRSQDGG